MTLMMFFYEYMFYVCGQLYNNPFRKGKRRRKWMAIIMDIQKQIKTIYSIDMKTIIVAENRHSKTTYRIHKQ